MHGCLSKRPGDAPAVSPARRQHHRIRHLNFLGNRITPFYASRFVVLANSVLLCLLRTETEDSLSFFLADRQSAAMTIKNQTSIEYVLFDWDGTLLDSFEADANAYRYMFERSGDELEHGGVEAALLAELAPRVPRRAASPRQMGRSRPFVEIFLPEAATEAAAGRAAACCERWTGASSWRWCRAGAARACEGSSANTSVSAMFLAKVCSEDAPRRKPHPAPLRMALEKLRALPQASVYIGDAPEDIEMAHRAGVRAIGVLGGSPVPERLRAASPDAMIETIRELPSPAEEDSTRMCEGRLTATLGCVVFCDLSKMYSSRET